MREIVAVDAEAHAGAGEHLGRAVEDDTALEHDDAVEVVGDGTELVGDEQHAGAVLLQQVDERVAEERCDASVDAGDRFVEDRRSSGSLASARAMRLAAAVRRRAR